MNWTKEMEKIISDNWESKTDQELAVILGVTKKAVGKKRTRMGLCRRCSEAIPIEIINYAIELVKSGKTYVEAVKETSMKFNTRISISTVHRHYEKANVSSKRFRNVADNKHIEEEYKRLYEYNDRLLRLKKEIKIGDEVNIASRGNVKVVEKYPNFIVCIVNSFKESILYTDIKRIVKNTV